VRARRDGAIHPMAWSALLNSEKADVLDLELLSDEFVKVDAAGDHVTPHESGRAILDLQRAAKFIENFERKKSDLTLVIILVIEKTIAANTMPGDAFG
jgi:hypothetical protein